MDKKRIIEILEEIGTVLEITDDNPFRAKAYQKAAFALSKNENELSELIQSKSLTKIAGIGKNIAEVIIDLAEKNFSQVYDDLQKNTPQVIYELLKVNGLGAKKIKILLSKLNIKSLDELKVACENKRLRLIEGFGEKTENNILESIKFIDEHKNQILYSDALTLCNNLVNTIKNINGVVQCELSGDMRRKALVISRIVVLIECENNKNNIITERIKKLDFISKINSIQNTRVDITIDNIVDCEIIFAEKNIYPLMQMVLTGSDKHLIKLVDYAKEKGIVFNPSIMIKEKRSYKDEKEIYDSIGLNFIPPELREDCGEVEFSKENTFPILIDEKDIKGVFHTHTNYSDGINSIEQIITACKNKSWNYVGISDHSNAAGYAGGMSTEKAILQIKEIEKINSKQKDIYVFKGVECDILSDGMLDYNDELLSQYDFVIASVHSKFNMTEKEATKRIITSLKNKYVNILGHPTGRLLLERDGYPINIKEIINAASDYGKAIEINSNPKRLDLSWEYLHYAKDKNIKIFINPDAHSIRELDYYKYGVEFARKGWLQSHDVVNTWNVGEVKKYFKK